MPAGKVTVKGLVYDAPTAALSSAARIKATRGRLVGIHEGMRADAARRPGPKKDSSPSPPPGTALTPAAGLSVRRNRGGSLGRSEGI